MFQSLQFGDDNTKTVFVAEWIAFDDVPLMPSVGRRSLSCLPGLVASYKIVVVHGVAICFDMTVSDCREKGRESYTKSVVSSSAM